MKKCNFCLIEKPLDRFSKKKSCIDGFNTKCKDCHNKYNREIWYIKNRDKQKMSSVNWKIDNKDRIKATKYGVTPEDIVEFRILQNDKCAICLAENFTENIDHCHKKGNVRGILCGNCNKGLGLFKDNIEYLLNAINYLNNNN